MKENHADASRLDMYKGITLPCAAAKLFESVFMGLFSDSMYSDNLQFGFKKNNSCCPAVFVFNEPVRHFIRHGSRVHCASKMPAKRLTRFCALVCFTKWCLKVYHLCSLRC